MDLLLAGRSTSQVAEELGVDRRTVNRWREDPVFDEEYQRRQLELHDAVHAALVAKSLKVAEALTDIALDDTVDEDDKGRVIPRTPAMARVHACRIFFELLGRHKNRPVEPSEKGSDPETPEQLLEVLSKVPAPLLEEALAAKRKPRERAKEKDL